MTSENQSKSFGALVAAAKAEAAPVVDVAYGVRLRLRMAEAARRGDERIVATFALCAAAMAVVCAASAIWGLQQLTDPVEAFVRYGVHWI